MIKVLNRQLVSFVCLALSVISYSSCKKSDNAVSGQVQLISFGPSGARVGDTLRFLGNNLDKVTEIDFAGNGATVPRSMFIKQTPDLILLKIPALAEQGYVTLKIPQTVIVSKTKLNLNVVTSVTSVTKQARPGETITITGDYLNWVSRVTFNKNKVVDSNAFVSKSINKLEVIVPSDAQTGPLVLSYGGSEPKDVQSADTLNVTLPVITSLTPNPVKHQTNLTILGTDLDLAKQVVFNGVATPVSTFVSQSASTIVVTVPAGAKGGKVVLVAASGITTQSSVDLTLLLPAISTISPNPVDPGANLTITGTNLSLVTSINFQNAPAVTSFVSQTDTTIVVTVPMGVLKGLLTFGILNSTLTVQSPVALDLNGSVPPPTIALPIYDDAVTSNWNGWVGSGWGGAKDLNNTSPVRDGTKSIKIDYSGGYGSPLQLGGGSLDLSPYTTFKISVYGAPGSGGKTISIAFNKTNGKYNINVVEGKWTDYAIPISTLTSSSTLTEIWVQEFSGTGGFSIFVDDLGFN